MAISSFVMNAKGIIFTNSKHNPTRSWLARMIEQLKLIASQMEIPWNAVSLTIKMHPDLWQCISHLYSYGYYFDKTEKKNCYLTVYASEAQCRHEEYQHQKALPIIGRYYSIETDDNINLSDIMFITNIDEISGIIKNVNCEIEYGDN